MAAPPRSSTPGAEVPARRGRARTWLSRGLRLFVWTLALGAGVFLLRGRLLAPLLIGAAERWAEREHGAELRIGSLSGGYLRDLEVQGIVWRADRGPLRVLEAGRARIDYSLTDLLRGRPALRRIELAAERLELDLTAPRARTFPRASFPARIPAVELALAHATVALPAGNRLALEEGALSLAPLADEEVLALAARRLELTGPGGALASDLELHARRRGDLVELESLRLGPDVAALAGTLDLGDLENGRAGWQLAVSIAAGSATLEGRLEAGELSTRIDAAALDLARASALAAPWTDRRLAGICDLGARVSFAPGSAAGLRAEAETTLRGLAFEGLALDELAATFELAGERMTVHELHARRASDRLEARDLVLTVAPAWREVVAGASGEIAVECADVTQLWRFAREPGAVAATLRGAVRPGPAFSLAGKVTTSGGELALRRGELALDLDRPLASPVECLFDVDVSDVAPLAALFGRDWRGSFSGEMELRGALGAPLGNLRAEGKDLWLEGIPFDTLRAELVADGEAVTLSELVASGGRFSGSARGSYRFDSRTFTAESLTVASGDGSLEARGTVALRADGTGEARIEELLLRDQVSEVRLADPTTLRFGPGRRLACDSFELASAQGGASGSFTLDGDDFSAWTSLARIDLGLLAKLGTPLELPRGTLEGRIEVARRERMFSGVADLTLDSSAGDARFTARLEGPEEGIAGALALEIAAFRWEPLEPYFGDQTLELALAVGIGEEIALERAELRGSRDLHANASGTFASRVDLRELRPFRDWLRSLRARPFRLETDFELANLGWLAERFETLRRLEGRVAGRGTASGTIDDPHFAGELHVREGELRLTSGIVVREVSSDLSFEGRRMTIVSLEGELGAAPLSASGTLDVTGGALVLDVALTGTNVLLYRDPEVQLRADLQIALRGPPERLGISGALAIVDGKYTRDVELLRRVLSGGKQGGGRGLVFALWRQPPLADAQLDVAISSRAPFELENNFVTADLRADLRLGGTGAFPVFSGLVYVDKARVSLPSGTLHLDAGFLRFRPEDPFFPELVLSGSSRLSGYDVEVQVSGPYDRPDVLLTSSPALPNDELLVLFLTGQVPEGSFADRGRGAAESVSVFFAEDVLERWLFRSSPDDRDSIFDRLELEIGAEVTQSGSPTARATLLLSNRPPGEKRVPYLVAERDAYDKINFGIGIRFRFR